jgi:hypothetical protein
MVVEGLLPLASHVYGGGTVPAVAVPWEWWLFTNFPARYGLIVDVVAFVLASVSSGESCDVIVRGGAVFPHGLHAP